MSDAMNYARLAGLYDVYVQASFDLPFFLREAARVQGRVLELMAGTGRVAIPLLEEGILVDCVDSSPEMLAVLRAKIERQNLDDARVYQQDVRSLNLPALYALAYMPFHSFHELLTPADQRAALAAVYRHLIEGGVFICTLHNPGVRAARSDGQFSLWGKFPMVSPDGTLLLFGLEQRAPRSDLISGLQTFELYDERGVLRSKRFSEYRFTLIEPNTFEELARAAGFTVAACYGDYDYSSYDEAVSPYQIWMLKK